MNQYVSQIKNHKKYIILIILVIVIVSAFLFVGSTDNNPRINDTNNTNNTTIEDPSNYTGYEGVYLDGNKISINPDEILNKHMSILKESNTHKITIKNVSNKSLIRVDNKQVFMEKENDVGITTNSYSDGNHTYIREGNAIEGLNYSSKNGTIRTDKYPENTLKSILSNSNVKSHNITNSKNIRIYMNSTSTDRLSSLLDVPNMKNFNLEVEITEGGLIRYVTIEFDEIDNGVDRRRVNYEVNISSNTTVKSPGWLVKAKDYAPIEPENETEKDLVPENNTLEPIEEPPDSTNSTDENTTNTTTTNTTG